MCESDNDFSQSQTDREARIDGLPRTINPKGATLSSDVGEKPETNHKVVTYQKMTLKKKHRRNHSQRASGQKHGYEDSEKNTEDLEQR